MPTPTTSDRCVLLWRALLAICLLTIAACNGPQGSARRGEADLTPYWPKPQPAFNEVKLAALQVPVPEIPDAEYVNDDELCMVCHEAYTKSQQHNVHRQTSCEKCHGPASRHLSTRGKEAGTMLNFKKLSPPQRSELCLKCHEQDACAPGARWRISPHAHHGVACTDCHTSHYNVPPGTPATNVGGELSEQAVHETLVSLVQEQPPVDYETLRIESNNMGAITPQVCYRCHANMHRQEEVAHPHQIGGSTGFDCTTCHDPHGKIREESRTQLCLQCHNNQTPAMAWHSSTHALYGVACTNCHNPHPNPNVQAVVNISHTHISRPRRLPMSVDEPNVCYRCHTKIYALTSLPSHHPIKEGKMVCSDCHDGHGQSHGNLKGFSANQVCYRCHAEKQGPFVWEHPPVTENCGICHEPHGTVANNLLHQPTTFLCLRCHAGHRKDNRNPDPTWVAEGAPVPNRPNPTGLIMRAAQFTDCSQCHAQIHGSDVPSNSGRGTFLR